MKVVVYENEKVVNTFEGNDIYVACGRQLFVTYDMNCRYYTCTDNIKLRKCMLKTTLRGHKGNIKKFKIEGVQV